MINVTSRYFRKWFEHYQLYNQAKNPKIVAVLNKNISIRVIQRVFLSFTKFILQGVGLVISIYVNCMKRATKIYQNI